MNNAAPNNNLDVLVIGNAGIDTFLIPKESSVNKSQKQIIFPFGAKIPIDYAFTEIGGGGANTAVGIARHGLKTSLISKLGNDENAKKVIQRLQENKVITTQIKKGKKETDQSYILQGNEKDATILGYHGAGLELKIEDIPKGTIKRSKYVLVNALYGQSANILKYISVSCMENNVKLALNLGIDQINFYGSSVLKILQKTDLLILNKHEAENLYHVLTNNHHRYSERCKDCIPKTSDILKYLKEIGVETVVITLGPKGAKCISDKIYSIKAKDGNEINYTGLGDAFFSGFLSYLILGKTIEEALERGMDNSVSVMEHIGSQIGLLYY